MRRGAVLRLVLPAEGVAPRFFVPPFFVPRLFVPRLFMPLPSYSHSNA